MSAVHSAGAVCSGAFNRYQHVSNSVLYRRGRLLNADKQVRRRAHGGWLTDMWNCEVRSDIETVDTVPPRPTGNTHKQLITSATGPSVPLPQRNEYLPVLFRHFTSTRSLPSTLFRATLRLIPIL